MWSVRQRARNVPSGADDRRRRLLPGAVAAESLDDDGRARQRPGDRAADADDVADASPRSGPSASRSGARCPPRRSRRRPCPPWRRAGSAQAAAMPTAARLVVRITPMSSFNCLRGELTGSRRTTALRSATDSPRRARTGPVRSGSPAFRSRGRAEARLTRGSICASAARASHKKCLGARDPRAARTSAPGRPPWRRSGRSRPPPAMAVETQTVVLRGRLGRRRRRVAGGAAPWAVAPAFGRWPRGLGLAAGLRPVFGLALRGRRGRARPWPPTRAPSRAWRSGAGACSGAVPTGRRGCPIPSWAAASVTSSQAPARRGRSITETKRPLARSRRVHRDQALSLGFTPGKSGCRV